MRKRNCTRAGLFYSSISLLLFLTSAGHVAAGNMGPDVAWMIPPNRSWYRYPALEYCIAQRAPSYSIALPLGLAGMFRTGADPTVYIRDRSRFLEEFDLLSSLIQLKHPLWYLLALPQSPSLIRVIFEKSAVTVDDGSGTPLTFKAVSGSGGISRENSLLLPPPIIGLAARKDNLVFRPGVFAGLEGYSLGPDETLETAISDREILPEVQYGLHASLSASAGLCGGITWVLHRNLPEHGITLVFAPRLYLYSILGYFSGAADAYFVSNDTGLPESWSYSLGSRQSFPGEGMGIGSRVDIGVLLASRNFVVAGTLLDIIGLKYVSGSTTAIDRKGRRSSRFSGYTVDYVPAPLIMFRWRLPVADLDTVLSCEARLIESFGGAVGISLRAEPVSFAAMARYNDSVQMEVRTGLRMGRIRVEGAAVFFEEPLSGENLIGYSLGVEVFRGH